jgi:hypothetical protein
MEHRLPITGKRNCKKIPCNNDLRLEPYSKVGFLDLQDVSRRRVQEMPEK